MQSHLKINTRSSFRARIVENDFSAPGTLGIVCGPEQHSLGTGVEANVGILALALSLVLSSALTTSLPTGHTFIRFPLVQPNPAVAKKEICSNEPFLPTNRKHTFANRKYHEEIQRASHLSVCGKGALTVSPGPGCLILSPDT